LKAVSIYKLGNLDLSATWIFSTGRPYTAPLGAYQIQLADGTEKTFFAVSDRNSFRYPNYHRLDIAATYRFDLFWTTGKAWSISASVFNLYNRKNVSSKQFEVVDNSILESNINYLSITPNLSFLVKF
jgi:outer membrane receptor protein involved in Fe transport